MASDQLARLQKRLKAIPKAVRDAVQPALKASGQELVDAMKALAEPSRKTGELIELDYVHDGRRHHATLFRAGRFARGAGKRRRGHRWQHQSQISPFCRIRHVQDGRRAVLLARVSAAEKEAFGPDQAQRV